MNKVSTGTLVLNYSEELLKNANNLIRDWATAPIYSIESASDNSLPIKWDNVPLQITNLEKDASSIIDRHLKKYSEAWRILADE